MAESTTQTTPDPSDASAPATSQPTTPPVQQPAAPVAPAARRTVTLPVLPFAIVGSVLVALLFFGGGIAVGFAIGGHHPRMSTIQPFTGRTGPFGGFGQNGGGHRFAPNGGQPGFGQNGGPNGGPNGDQGPQPSPAPTNG
jgi:hypothetical protein